MKALNLLFFILCTVLIYSCNKDETTNEVPLSEIEGSWLWSNPEGTNYSSLIVTNFEIDEAEFALYKKHYDTNWNLLSCYGEKGNIFINDTYIVYEPVQFAEVAESSTSEPIFNELLWFSKYDQHHFKIYH